MFCFLDINYSWFQFLKLLNHKKFLVKNIKQSLVFTAKISYRFYYKNCVEKISRNKLHNLVYISVVDKNRQFLLKNLNIRDKN